MLHAFFHILRAYGIKVTPKEWLDLCRLLRLGRIRTLDELYAQGRAVLVKSEKLYDLYDQAWIAFMNEGRSVTGRLEELLGQMADGEGGVAANIADLGIDEILERFNERFANQEGRHTGGEHHIGRRGRSPFGNAGAGQTGIRLGGGSDHGRAFHVAARQAFRNLREDVVLDTRTTAVALKKLRRLRETGAEDELDLPATIDRTAANFGDIDLVFRRERRNNVRVLLLMDNGGSMEQYHERVERLLSAARNLRYFREFRHFYFHNCIYDRLYEDFEQNREMTTDRLLRLFAPDWHVIIVGDALMSPYELRHSWQMVYRMERTGRSGIDWLRTVRNHFRHAVWLNPVPQGQWQHQTVKAIGRLFPMFPLTIEGIERAVKELVKPAA